VEEALQMSIASRPLVMVLDPLTPADLICGFDRDLVVLVCACLCLAAPLIAVLIILVYLLVH